MSGFGTSGNFYPNDTFKRYLIHTAEIWRPAGAGDGQGGQDKTYNKVNELRGRMTTRKSASGNESFIGNEFTTKLGYVWFCLPNQDIKRNDILKVNGQTFRVVNGKEPSIMGHHDEWLCEEVDPSTAQVYAGLPQTPPIE